MALFTQHKTIVFILLLLSLSSLSLAANVLSVSPCQQSMMQNQHHSSPDDCHQVSSHCLGAVCSVSAVASQTWQWFKPAVGQLATFFLLAIIILRTIAPPFKPPLNLTV